MNFFYRENGFDIGQGGLRGHAGIAGGVGPNDDIFDIEKAQHLGGDGLVSFPLLWRQSFPSLQSQQGVDDRGVGEILELEFRVAAGVAL